MADQKISAMPAAAALTGAELIPLVQSGANVKATVDVLVAYDKNYGAFSSTLVQTGSTSAGTAFTFNGTDVTDGVILANSSRLVVPKDGVYDVQFSAQLKNVDNAQHIVNIWFRVDGIDVPNSNTQVTVPARKTANIYGYLAPAWNIFLDLTANQYIEIVWLPVSTNVSVEAAPASVSPAYPAVPSIIATVQQVA